MAGCDRLLRCRDWIGWLCLRRVDGHCGLYCRWHDLLAGFGPLSIEPAALCHGAASALVLQFSRDLRHDLCLFDYADFRIDPIEL